MSFASSIQNRVEWLVLWQRASGGFTAGQQRELAQRVMADLGLASAKAKKPNPQVERESWRLLASLERLDAATRVKIGDEVVRRLRRDEGNASLLWSIGRLGARTPIYGPLTSVVAASDAGRWLEELVANERSPEVLRGDRSDRRIDRRPAAGSGRARVGCRTAAAVGRWRRTGPGAAGVRGSGGDVCRHEPCLRRAAAEWVAPKR